MTKSIHPDYIKFGATYIRAIYQSDDTIFFAAKDITKLLGYKTFYVLKKFCARKKYQHLCSCRGIYYTRIIDLNEVKALVRYWLFKHHRYHPDDLPLHYCDVVALDNWLHSEVNHGRA